MHHLFSQWLLKNDLGRYLRICETRFFKKKSEDIFGLYAIQLGLPQYNLLHHCRITHGAIIDSNQPATILAELSQLPFENNSIDLILLPHTLDLGNEPHEILIEVKRVLSPGGHILLTGFNPYSLWGLRHFCHKKKITLMPWDSTFLSLNRLKDWLKLLELEIEGGSFMAYVPPFVSGLKYFKLIDSIGDRWWATGAAIYGISIIKKTYGIHPLKPHWKNRKATRQLVATASEKRSL